jgi:hypothetical protein
MIRPSLLGVALAVLWAASLPGLSWAGEEPGEGDGLWAQESNVGYGPFESVSLSPFSSLRPGFRPTMPSTLGDGSFEARVAQSWAKVISSSADWVIDYEIARTSVKLAYGITHSLSVDLEVDSSERSPGSALQHFMLGFHRIFGIQTAYLTAYPAATDRFQVTPPGGGPPIEVQDHDREPFVAGGLLRVQQTLSAGDDWMPAAAGALSLRTDFVQENLQGGSPVDLAASLSFSKGAGPVVFYLGADVEWYGTESFFGIPMRPIQWSILGAVEWRALPGFSVLGQYLLKSGAVDQLHDFSLPSNEITAGFKWEIGAGFLISVAILENVVNPYNTPDFGFHLELALRF